MCPPAPEATFDKMCELKVHPSHVTLGILVKAYGQAGPGLSSESGSWASPPLVCRMLRLPPRVAGCCRLRPHSGHHNTGFLRLAAAFEVDRLVRRRLHDSGAPRPAGPIHVSSRAMSTRAVAADSSAGRRTGRFGCTCIWMQQLHGVESRVDAHLLDLEFWAGQSEGVRQWSFDASRRAIPIALAYQACHERVRARALERMACRPIPTLSASLPKSFMILNRQSTPLQLFMQTPKRMPM